MLHKVDSATTILSARALVRAETIDGGDTIVLHMQGADGTSASVLMPRHAAQAVRSAIDTELAAPRRQSPFDAGI
ncbi:hypothetical protein [Methylobacterium iners]|uniref:hypothetical protein n=1 Tax=Methylobacterium iners TaxID=418707 RepID=UPI001EE1F749|nr:hypothetical protein [Methylobacterium iners]